MITLTQQRNGVTVTLQGDTLEEVKALLPALDELLPTAYNSGGLDISNDSISPDKCPKHHKSKVGQFGLYCPTKLANGTWCKWKE